MAKHMGLDERKRIELLLGLRWKVAEIAHEMGRTESTISREILSRRVTSNRGYGCTNRICEHFDTCRRMRSWGAQQKLHKHLSRCFEGCDEFRERACLRVGSSPYVCNGCEKIHNCPLVKRLYVASAAQANYGGTLRESRSVSSMSPAETCPRPTSADRRRSRRRQEAAQSRGSDAPTASSASSETPTTA